MRHFSASEFRCGCGCGLNLGDMSQAFVTRLDLARDISKTSYSLNRSISCAAHNEKIGGLDNSAHLTGHAADIRVVNSVERYKILEGLIKAGFKRIGVYKTFIHVDDDETKPAGVAWVTE